MVTKLDNPELTLSAIRGLLHRYTHPILMVRALASMEDSESRQFRTQLATTALRESDPPPEERFYVLHKAPDLVATQVTIGRARNMDIVLNSSQISKLHTFIKQDPTSLAYVLGDAGSTNGTFHNEVRLEKMVTAPLQHEDRIRFANVFEAVFLVPNPP